MEKAVRYLEEFLKNTNNPYYAGTFEYGPGMPHCYSGDPTVPVSISRLTINQRILPVMAERITKTAPPGADVSSWKY